MKKGKFFIQRAVLSVTLFTIASKVLGYAFDVVFAYYFGTTSTSDAYLMAISIITLFFGWLDGTAVAYTSIGKKIQIRDEKGFAQLTNQLIQVLLIFSTICAATGFLFPGFFTGIAAPGFSSETRALTESYVRVLSFNIILSSLIQISAAYLNCKDLYIQSSSAMLIHGVLRIIVLIIVVGMGAQFLSYAYLLANLAYFIVLLINMTLSGFRPSFTKGYWRECRQIIVLSLPLFISKEIMQINSYVDKVLASGLPAGSISALSYADHVRTFAIMIFNTGLVTVMLPLFSKYVKEQNMDGLKQSAKQCFEYILLICIPLTVGCLLLSYELIGLLYGRGSFTEHSIITTSQAFSMYAFSIPFIALQDILLRLFYAWEDTKTPLLLSAAGVGVNIVLSLLLVRYLQHSGLALATSIAAIVSFLGYLWFIQKKTGKLLTIQLKKLALKCVVASLIMGAAVMGILWLFNNAAATTWIQVIKLVICALGGMAVYALMLIILKTSEVKRIFQSVADRIKAKGHGE